MTRQLLAILAAFTVLTFGGITGAMAQQSNPCAGKSMSQPEGAKSEKDPSDAVRKAKTAPALAELVIPIVLP